MGAWGTGISSNDTYGDVYDQFFELYNEGKEVEEVTEIVTKQNWELLEMPDAVNDFWFALAKAQWECKELHSEVFCRVKEIVESGRDLEVWRDLGASESDIGKRKRVLEKFVISLQAERPKARKRKKKVIREPIFRKGDCLTYKISDKNYGASLVLEAEYGTELGLNLIAITRIDQPEKPTVKEIKRSNVLIMNFEKWVDVPAVQWPYNYKSKEVINFIEVLGSIEVQRDFLSKEEKYKYSFSGGWEMALIKIPNWQFESEKTKPGPNAILPIIKLIKKGFWERITSIL
jgi:hypothetical protein